MGVELSLVLREVFCLSQKPLKLSTPSQTSQSQYLLTHKAMDMYHGLESMTSPRMELLCIQATMNHLQLEFHCLMLISLINLYAVANGLLFVKEKILSKFLIQ